MGETFPRRRATLGDGQRHVEQLGARRRVRADRDREARQRRISAAQRANRPSSGRSCRASPAATAPKRTRRRAAVRCPARSPAELRSAFRSVGRPLQRPLRDRRSNTVHRAREGAAPGGAPAAPRRHSTSSRQRGGVVVAVERAAVVAPIPRRSLSASLSARPRRISTARSPSSIDAPSNWLVIAMLRSAAFGARSNSRRTRVNAAFVAERVRRAPFHEHAQGSVVSSSAESARCLNAAVSDCRASSSVSMRRDGPIRRIESQRVTKRVRGASLRVPHSEQLAIVVEALAQLRATRPLGRAPRGPTLLPRRQRFARQKTAPDNAAPRTRSNTPGRSATNRFAAAHATARPRSCCSAAFARSAAMASPRPANAKFGSCVSA